MYFDQENELTAKVSRGILPATGWKLIRIEFLEGSHGEAKYETCEHCKKNIRNLCFVSSEHGDFVVGPDCALSLLPLDSEDAASIQDYVGRRIKFKKFLKAALAFIEASIPLSESEHQIINSLGRLYHEGGWRFGRFADELPSWNCPDKLTTVNAARLFSGALHEGAKIKALREGMEGLSFQRGLEEERTAALPAIAAKRWYEVLIATDEGKERLAKALKKAFESGSSMKQKKYLIDDAGRCASEFLMEYRDELTIGDSALV